MRRLLQLCGNNLTDETVVGAAGGLRANWTLDAESQPHHDAGNSITTHNAQETMRSAVKQRESDLFGKAT